MKIFSKLITLCYSIFIYEGAAERIEGIQRLNVKLQGSLIYYGGSIPTHMHIAELICSRTLFYSVQIKLAYALDCKHAPKLILGWDILPNSCVIFFSFLIFEVIIGRTKQNIFVLFKSS